MKKRIVKKQLLITATLGLGLTLLAPMSFTQAATFDGKTNAQNPKITASQSIATSPVRTLKLTSPYMSGDDVEFAQTLLNVNADRVYGPNTAQAVKNLQSKYGLAVDGVIGENTWKVLHENAGWQTLRVTSPYMSGNDVKLLQAHVGVSQDGIYGPNTAQAVKNFQSKYGLTADGVVGTNTWFMVWREDH
ncbi:peptidoglycan-binding protein [Bacillus paramycoides]|uniref:peptidoglycan-binding domain-containing protein n=1 Tax=Bacillus paramycoides TaxID=2026194 RepID=UPI002E24A5D5|nr:peptidoglycan-binding protein [Bacillus paramycoides]